MCPVCFVECVKVRDILAQNAWRGSTRLSLKKEGECGTPRKTSETNENRETARLENLHGCRCKTAESFPALRSFALN